MGCPAPFDNTAGTYIDTTALQGSVTLPAGFSITSFSVTTAIANAGGSTNATVNLGAFNGGMFNMTANSDEFMLAAVMGNVQRAPDNLSQSGTMDFTVAQAAVGQTITINFPDSAQSQINPAPTPEPASIVVWGLAIALGLFVARRRGKA